jgi:hypothetical protein
MDAMQEKELDITQREKDIGVEGRCKKCDRQFGPYRDANTSPSVANKRMVNDFNAHDCEEDASQAAARIVKEATEDH